jgi:hypothetical protein
MAAANKKARDAGFKRLVDLITKTNAGTATLDHQRRSVPLPARKSVLASTAPKKPAAVAVQCHDETPAGKSVASTMPGGMDMSTMM